MLADRGTEKQVYEMSALNSSRVLKKSPLITTVPKLIAQLKYMLFLNERICPPLWLEV